MNYNYLMTNSLGNGLFGWGGISILVIWSLIWKGLALWKAARRGENIWFIVLLVVNTMGILEIIYYYFVGKETKKTSKRKK